MLTRKIKVTVRLSHIVMLKELERDAKEDYGEMRIYECDFCGALIYSG